jgi:ABC-type nitrate/sulfonate/bicarbonate transport system permease component
VTIVDFAGGARALLAFGIGSVFGLATGLWLALSPTANAIREPHITALNSIPRIILVLTGFALLLDALAGRIERRLMKRQPRAGETEKR